MHLNPVRARMLAQVERLSGEHGIQEDRAAGRGRFEEMMERRSREETEAEALKALRRGWCVGSGPFQREMLARMEGGLGEYHAGGVAPGSGTGQGREDWVGGVAAARVGASRAGSTQQERPALVGDWGAVEERDNAVHQGDSRPGGAGKHEGRQCEAAPAQAAQSGRCSGTSPAGDLSA